MNLFRKAGMIFHVVVIRGSMPSGAKTPVYTALSVSFDYAQDRL